jgi:RNA polymerase sigma-70 factor (ECF subfamily)
LDPSKTRRFEALVLPHMDAAFNLARWLTQSDQDGEDVVQEACVRAFRFFDSFQGDQGRAWLLAIVRNTAMSWLQGGRASSSTREYDEARHAEGHMDGPESLLQRKDEEGQVNRALRQLAVEFREVLILREIEDLSYREIAHIAAIPIGTVMSRLSRARKEFAALLAKETCNER